MAPLRSALKTYSAGLVVGHSILWLFGCFGIGLAANRLRKQVRQQREMQAALRESEERSRILVENAPFGLSIMSPDQRFEYFNPKFTATFGYTLDDIQDKAAWFEKAYPGSRVPECGSKNLDGGFVPSQRDGQRNRAENVQGEGKRRPGADRPV